MLAPGLLFAIIAVDVTASRAKLITGLAPCPTGAPPARECLVSVLVDLRALRAKGLLARQRNATTLHGPGQATPQPGYNLVAEADLAVNKPRGGELDLKKKYEEHEELLRQEFLREQQEQQRKQAQLEQAVRFQEDELQQLRDQVQELRVQLSRALQLYQLQAAGPAGGGGNIARFYRTLPRGPSPSFGQRIQRRSFQFQEVASGVPVVAT